MEQFETRQFTSRYNKIMLYTFSAVLLVSAILITIQTLSKKNFENKELVDQFKTESIALDNLIVRVTVLLDMMQSDAEAFLKNPRSNASIYIDALDEIDEQHYALDTVPKPFNEANSGNLSGKGVLSNVILANKDELEMSFNLNGLFASTVNSIPNAAWVYYTSKNDFINIYPWVSSSEFKFSNKLYNKEFYQLGLPENNPNKRIFWTSIYKDEAGKGMMVTAAKPIYRDSEFLGTVAIDFTLEELAGYVQEFRPDKGKLFIINTQGQLLAHPEISPSVDVHFSNAIPQGIDLVKSELVCDGTTVSSLKSNYQYVCYQMQNAPWQAVYIEKTPYFLVSAFSSVGLVFIILLSALGVLLVIMKKITFREFIFPAESLVQHIFRQGVSENESANKVPTPWTPWFLKITETFEQNRNLIDEIKQKNSELTDLNISLERYMPKFVLVVSLEPGCGATTVGTCFADTLAKSDKDKKTVYMEYPQNQALASDDGLSIGSQTIHKHLNGFDVWNDFDLGEVPESAKSSLLMTKILNQYSNIVLNTIVNDEVDDFIDVYLEPLFRYAKAIVVMVPSDDTSGDRTSEVVRKIQRHVRQDQTTIYTLLNRIKNQVEYQFPIDFEIPFTQSIMKFSKDEFQVDDEVSEVIHEIVDRIERVHQISMFIPTTIDVDKPIDASIYVDKAMVFLGEKFGGATSSQARGVWNSDDSGIVNEVVHIVVSYTTEDDLNRFANDVIEFIKSLKHELKQEAMALEINKKMILV
ncbi:hypothetical protein NBRC116188_21540 [Oceaniserpentilla sp. 4NH20-0058]|uniref:cache domain-containing protein n=1 Tax=Oceaniserpentilla sp. 4NH20-0058 TaxID=3127660 RepID=UPI003109557C